MKKVTFDNEENKSDNVGLTFYGFDGEATIKFKNPLLENVARILTTLPGERVGNLEFGSYVRNYIFQQETTVDELINEIKRSIETWEPRVSVQECTVSGMDNEMLDINLVLLEKSTGELLETDVKI